VGAGWWVQEAEDPGRQLGIIRLQLGCSRGLISAGAQGGEACGG